MNEKNETSDEMGKEEKYNECVYENDIQKDYYKQISIKSLKKINTKNITKH